MTGIILLVIYTVVMLAVTFKDRAKDSLAFNVANRNIGTWSGALSIAATWIWAPALFVSAGTAQESREVRDGEGTDGGTVTNEPTEGGGRVIKCPHCGKEICC